MQDAHFIPLPLLLKEPLKQEPKTTTKSQLYYMSFVLNDFPIIKNTEIFIVRSSSGGLSLRFFPGPLTNTIDMKGDNYLNLYPDVDKITGNGLARPRGMVINHWNFNRFTKIYNEEVAPIVDGILYNDNIVNLFRNTTIVDEILTFGLIYMMMQLCNYRLSIKEALSIMERTDLKLYLEKFPTQELQKSACELIQAYWVLSQIFNYQDFLSNKK